MEIFVKMKYASRGKIFSKEVSGSWKIQRLTHMICAAFFPLSVFVNKAERALLRRKTIRVPDLNLG